MSVTGSAGAPADRFSPMTELEAPPPPAPDAPPAPPPAAPGAPPRPPDGMAADLLRDQIGKMNDREIDGARPIPKRIRELLEYGPWSSGANIGDDDIDDVLHLMQPMAIGGEWDEVIAAMDNGTHLDRFMECLLEHDSKDQFDRFVGWATDPNCRPETKAAIVRALTRQAESDPARAAEAIARILKSDPPGAAVGEMSDAELASAAQVLLEGRADLGALLERLPADAADRLASAIAKGAAERFHKLLPDADAIVEEMAQIPFGPAWDRTIQEMAGKASFEHRGLSDLDVLVTKLVQSQQGLLSDHPQWARLKEWAKDPNCAPETRMAILQSLSKVASGDVPLLHPGGRVRTDASLARKAMDELIAADPKGFARLVGAEPKKLLVENKELAEAAGRALTPEALATLMTEMKASGTMYTQEGMEALGKVMGGYIKAKGATDGASAKKVVGEFLAAASKAGLLNDPRDFGLVTGGLIAGMMHQFAAMDADKKTRDLIIGAILDIVPAGLAFSEISEVGQVATLVAEALKAGYAALDGGDDAKEAAQKMRAAIKAPLLAPGGMPERWRSWKGPQGETDPLGLAIDVMDTVIQSSGFN